MKTLSKLNTEKTIKSNEIEFNSNFDFVDEQLTELMCFLSRELRFRFTLDVEKHKITCSLFQRNREMVERYISYLKMANYFLTQKQIVPVLDVEICKGHVSQFYVEFDNIINYL